MKISFDKKVSLLLIGVLVILPSLVSGQSSGGNYSLSSSTIDGGGGASSGGGYSLTGTIGQPDAASAQMFGGEFILKGGFWGSITSFQPLIFKDSFEQD